MKRAKAIFEKSGLTLEELGERMGIESKTARMSAWQFLNKTADPRLSMLIRFAKAMGILLEELIGDKVKKKKRSRSNDRPE